MFIRIFRRACNYTKAKMKTYTCRYTKRRPFSPSFYVKNYELLPMATICILDACMVAFCSIRTFLNTDLKYCNHIKTRGEDIELLKDPRCLKFYCPTQEYESNMDLYNLYQEMIEAQQCEDEPDSCERKEGGGWIISADKEKKETPPHEGEEEPEPPEKKLTDAQRKELERKEKERKDKERKEMEQKELERNQSAQSEKEQKQLEQKEKERKEKELKEKQQKEKEQKEKERKEKEQKEKERKEKERKELERKQMEQKEKERKEKERKEKEQKEKEKKKPDTQQKPKEDKSKERARRQGSQASIQSGSSGGSLSLEQIKKKIVIKENGIQSPELLFGETVNKAQHRKNYFQDGIHVTVTTLETTYGKGHKVVEDETTKIDTKHKKDTMHQKVITIVDPSGKSDIAFNKFFQEKGGKTYEIKEGEWKTAYPAVNIQKIKPNTHQRMTTTIQTKTRQENDKITEIVTTTKQYETGAQKIKEETTVKHLNGKSPPKVTVNYYMVLGGKRSTIGENEWEEVTIRPHISYSPKKTSETIQTENETDANGNQITRVTTTVTHANGDKEITTDTTTKDKNGRETHTHQVHKQPKNEKRRLLITGFF